MINTRRSERFHSKASLSQTLTLFVNTIYISRRLGGHVFNENKGHNIAQTTTFRAEPLPPTFEPKNEFRFFFPFSIQSCLTVFEQFAL